RSLVLAVREGAPLNITASIDKPAIAQGDKGNLTLKVARLSPDAKNPLIVTLADPVPNLVVNNNQPINLPPNNDTATVPAVVHASLGPGTYHLVFRGQTQIPYNKDPTAPQKQPINVLQLSTPVALAVLPKAVATVTATVPNPNAKAGTDAEVVVKVQRMFDYA